MSAPKADTPARADGAEAQAPPDVSSSDINAPDEVRLLRSERVVELKWAAYRVRVSFAELRRNCRCADCTAKRRAGLQIDAPENIEVIGINPIGAGALQFVFSDGHERGIFPWPYLTALAQDPEAIARKCPPPTP